MTLTYYAKCITVENTSTEPRNRVITFDAGTTHFVIAQPIRSLNFFKTGKMYRITLDEDHDN